MRLKRTPVGHSPSCLSKLIQIAVARPTRFDREFAVPAGMERMRARTALSNNSARVADDSKKEAATEKKESDDKEKTDEKAESRSEEASRQPSEEARRQQEDSNDKAQ